MWNADNFLKGWFQLFREVPMKGLLSHMVELYLPIWLSSVKHQFTVHSVHSFYLLFTLADYLNSMSCPFHSHVYQAEVCNELFVCFYCLVRGLLLLIKHWQAGGPSYKSPLHNFTLSHNTTDTFNGSCHFITPNQLCQWTGYPKPWECVLKNRSRISLLFYFLGNLQATTDSLLTLENLFICLVLCKSFKAM